MSGSGAIEKNSGNISFSGPWPTHLSCQNEVLLPLPTLVLVFIWKELHSCLIAFQTPVHEGCWLDSYSTDLSGSIFHQWLNSTRNQVQNCTSTTTLWVSFDYVLLSSYGPRPFLFAGNERFPINQVHVPYLPHLQGSLLKIERQK